jgi:hypothetical protein
VTDPSSPAPVAPAQIAWEKGGTAQVVSLATDAIVLLSSVPSPPGSRIEGRVEGEKPVTVRVKIHGSKRRADGAFVLEGRVLDATREVRARLEALAKLG